MPGSRAYAGEYTASVAQIMGYLKGKSSLMIFDRHANLKYKYSSRHFWYRGYYVDTVGRNKKVIEEYILSFLSGLTAWYGNTFSYKNHSFDALNSLGLR